MSAAADPRFRIGEIARRTGLSPSVLRAWETRYGLLEPVRSAGGTRLYSATDLATIAAMQSLIEAGLAPAEAAEAAVENRRAAQTRSETDPSASPPPGERSVVDARLAGSELQSQADALTSALTRLDRQRAEAALDALLSTFALATLVEEVFLPYLRDVGERWARGEASIAEEHFATNVLRAHMGTLSRVGDGPAVGRAVLACPPDERHDLPLVLLAALMRQRGWQTTLLGADTPIESVAQTAEAVGADVVILSAILSEHFESELTGLRSLAARWPVYLAGSGASDSLVAGLPVTRLTDLVSAAASMARMN